MAKNNVKKITVSAFENVMKDHFTNNATVDWHGVPIQITGTISLESALSFTKEIIDNCYDEETGTYLPESLDIVVRSEVLTRYANFTLPKDIGRRYQLIYQTDAFDVVAENINREQLDYIVNSALQKIEYMKQERISVTNRKLDEVLDQFDNLYEEFIDIIGSASSEDVERLTEFISKEGSIDYDRLIKAYSENAQNKE